MRCNRIMSRRGAGLLRGDSNDIGRSMGGDKGVPGVGDSTADMLRQLRAGILTPFLMAATNCGSTPSGPPRGEPHTLGSTGALHVE